MRALLKPIFLYLYTRYVKSSEHTIQVIIIIIRNEVTCWFICTFFSQEEVISLQVFCSSILNLISPSCLAVQSVMACRHIFFSQYTRKYSDHIVGISDIGRRQHHVSCNTQSYIKDMNAFEYTVRSLIMGGTSKEQFPCVQ